MKETELLKHLQLSSDEQLLTLARFIRPYDLTEIHMSVLEDRLAILGYNIEYGCCGNNKITKRV
jgi:hypothetical protein